MHNLTNGKYLILKDSKFIRERSNEEIMQFIKFINDPNKVYMNIKLNIILFSINLSVLVIFICINYNIKHYNQ